MLNLEAAQGEFARLLDRIDPHQVAEFLDWVNESFVHEGHPASDDATSIGYTENEAILRNIALAMRNELPIDAIANSETICWPQSGRDAIYDPTNTVHMDSFLYDDDDIDELVDAKLVSRDYCTQCGSKDTRPLTFISHSFSIQQLRYAFTMVVPLASGMEGRLVVDVGSRLGCVLYAVRLYGKGKVFAVGVEINKELCDLQNKYISANHMENMIKVLNDDVRNQVYLIHEADVVVVHDTFSFFQPPAEQVSCWKFLRGSMRTGAVLLTNPSIEDMTASLELPFKIDEWLYKTDTDHLAARFAGTDQDLFEEIEQITLYSVRNGASPPTLIDV